MKQDKTRDVINQLISAATLVDELIKYQFTGSSEAMSALQNAANACEAAVKEAKSLRGNLMELHRKREMVNELRDIAIKYACTQQLREQISKVVLKYIPTVH